MMLNSTIAYTYSDTNQSIGAKRMPALTRWFTLLTIFSIFITLSSSSQAQVKRTFPKDFKKLRFGMSMEQFAGKRKSVEPNHLTREKFRYVWVESFSSKYPFHTAKFYFSDKEERPFYELILFYSDLTARDNWLRKYFGAPNFKNNTEWELVSKDGQQLRAWRYEDRLIITALLPGTEWEEILPP